jgi:hypothetical protein
MKKSYIKTVLTLFLVLVMATWSLAGCKSNNQTEYPAYSVTDNTEFIELHHDGIGYRPYGVFLDHKFRGKQIGIREGNPKSKICEVKGYDSSEWIVEYLDEFMGGGDMLFKATGVTEIPAELEQYKQYDY